MAKQGPRKFTGSAQDYIDWFKGVELAPVVLPDSQTDGEGLPLRKDEEFSHPPLPDYMRRELGQTYAHKFQEELKNIEVGQNADTADSTETRWSLSIEEDSVEGSLLDDAEDVDAQKAQVYLHYDFSNKDLESTLPIFDAQKEILEKIAQYQVVIIEGETGCGKSTQVPQFILDDAVEKLCHCNIVVTQPRKIAAISLASRVCKERGWVLGKLVGYQVGLENYTDSDTRLSYVTTEVLVQKLIRRRSLDQYTHIILDEVHERDHHTDFALLIVKKLLRTVSPNVKIILMSATIDAYKFANYFASPAVKPPLSAPIISAGETTVHRVQIFYLDDLQVICNERPNVVPRLPSIYPDDPAISVEMYRMAAEMIKCFDLIERQEEGLSPSEFAKKRGAVLAFLPGLAEIENYIDFLSRESSRFQWQLFPLHSTITREEQQSVFAIPPSGFRKVIISTNVAESSITVPDIKYVIDFCLTKVLTCDVVTNYTSLKRTWASQASCKQRAGRCGRVSSGRVYRLVPQSFFKTLPPYVTPELCRIPLSQVILKTKVLDMGEPHSLLALALDPPNMADICRTILILKQMGALGVKSHGRVSSLDGDLTYLGKVVARLPVDPFLAKLIVMGYLFGCIRECVIIAAGLSLKSIHSRPFQDELNAYLSKVSWSYGSFSDCLAVLNVYDLWQGMKIKGEFLRPDSKHERDWARHSYVQLSVLQEVHSLVKELTHRLEALKITAEHRQNTPKNNQAFILKMCFAGAFFPLYYKRNIPEDYEREMCRELSGHDPFTTVVVGGLPADTNIIYDHQIRELFKECSQNLEIKYEGSKAYLQFPRTSGTSKKEEHFQAIPGECPTAMHLALKMRQVQRIRQDLVLTLYSPQEAQAKMKQVLGYNNEKSISLGTFSNGTSKQTLGSIRKRVTQPLLCRLKSPDLPKTTNHTWRVHVTYVNSAGHFWVVSNENNAVANLCYIQSKIECAVRNNQVPILPQNHIIPGCVCLAVYTDCDGVETYYRARIEEMYAGPNGSEEVLVFFVDYGNSEVIDARKLRFLPESVVEMNMMALECMLAELKPASKYTDGMWDPEATAWFKAHTLYRNFTVQIYSIVHGKLRVKLLDMDRGTVVSINQLLVSMGFAVKAEEFFLSKQNHELRALYSSQAEESSVCSDNSISSAFSSLSFNFETGPAKYAGRMQLRGPDSPLLLRFVAMTRTGGSKSVRIDSSSVNSTALDLEPQNPHDRLLLAASVTLDPSESSVTLRGTTLMPPIPGILPLCLLLFCPVAELRLSEDGTHYTGALIGLGGDDEGHAIYPDDDIEISFDIAFLQDDLILVNLIRFLMNAVLEEADEITDSILIPTQKKLKESVTKLLDVKRKYKVPENYSRPYYWRRVPEEDILHPNTNGVLNESDGLVFPLHCGIYLRPDNLNEKLLSKLKELKDLQNRLTASGSLPFSRVNATCPVCCVFLETLMNLQIHFLSTEHQHKELQFKLSSA